jgi:tetratricopeptide (TPR) repeat protein
METGNTWLIVLVKLASGISYLFLLVGAFLLFRLLAVREFGNVYMKILLAVLFIPRVVFWLIKSYLRDKRSSIESDGNKLFERGRYHEAIEKYTKAIKIHMYFDGNVYTFIRRAKVSVALGNYEDAIADTDIYTRLMGVEEKNTISEEETEKAAVFLDELHSIEEVKKLLAQQVS